MKNESTVCTPVRSGYRRKKTVSIFRRFQGIDDVWGDTVNAASRMESSGVPGEIQVGDSTYQI
jgi:hypothetical protein